MSCASRFERALSSGLLTLLFSCKPRPVETSEDGGGIASLRDGAGSTSPDASAMGHGASARGDFIRDYRGALGERTAVEAHLERSGDSVSGDFGYGASKTWLRLAGKADRHGSLALEESVNGRVTGRLTLRPAAGDALSGTWTSPNGDKTYPVALTLRGVPAATRATFIDFLVRLTRTKGKPATAAEVERALDGEVLFTPREGAELSTKHDLFFERAMLYVADVNNDGTKDFVLLHQNSVGAHADAIAGVYDVDGDKLRELPFEYDVKSPTFTQAPFIEVTPKGTVMRLRHERRVDAKGNVVRPVDAWAAVITQEYEILWSGGTVNIAKSPETRTP